MKLTRGLVYLATLSGLGISGRALVFPRADDPCAAIGGQKWVSPKAVRECYNFFPVNQTLKDNVRFFGGICDSIFTRLLG
jgi:hypothetical protein